MGSGQSPGGSCLHKALRIPKEGHASVCFFVVRSRAWRGIKKISEPHILCNSLIFLTGGAEGT